MKYIVLGGFSFLLFIIYDINSISYRQKVIKSFFGIGSLLLMYATWQLTLQGQVSFVLPALAQRGAVILAGIFALLLFYTLFIALPLQQTYFSVQGVSKVCDQGVYALCRHPGFLCFAGFYFFLWLCTGRPLLLYGGIIFTLLNLFYIWLQDRYIFPKQFTDYKHYQASTPFLWPNCSSLAKCMDSLPIIGVIK